MRLLIKYAERRKQAETREHLCEINAVIHGFLLNPNDEPEKDLENPSSSFSPMGTQRAELLVNELLQPDFLETRIAPKLGVYMELKCDVHSGEIVRRTIFPVTILGSAANLEELIEKALDMGRDVGCSVPECMHGVQEIPGSRNYGDVLLLNYHLSPDLYKDCDKFLPELILLDSNPYRLMGLVRAVGMSGDPDDEDGPNWNLVETGHFLSIVRVDTKIYMMDNLCSEPKEYPSFKEALRKDNQGYYLFGICYVVYKKI